MFLTRLFIQRDSETLSLNTIKYPDKKLCLSIGTQLKANKKKCTKQKKALEF